MNVIVESGLNAASIVALYGCDRYYIEASTVHQVSTFSDGSRYSLLFSNSFYLHSRCFYILHKSQSTLWSYFPNDVICQLVPKAICNYDKNFSFYFRTLSIDGQAEFTTYFTLFFVLFHSASRR